MSSEPDPEGTGTPDPQEPDLQEPERGAVDGPSIADAWRVCVLDENEIRGRIDADWIRERHECDLATAPTDLLSQIDQSTTVVCIRVVDDEYADLVRYIWEIYPHVQILLLLGRDDLLGVDRECDEQLQDPYSKADLQRTVSRLYGRGLYTLKLREFYQLTSFTVGRSQEVDRGEETDIDQLREQIDAVQHEIDAIVAHFDQTDFEGVLRAHRRRERALGTPTMDTGEEVRSKYRPPKCPNCGLSWGTDHGGRLGTGADRVAALVWRCRDCGDVLKVSPGEYDHVL